MADEKRKDSLAETPPWKKAIASANAKFNEICAKEGTALVFQKEALFAMQMITSNDHLMTAAMNNPNSLMNAIINIASIGLSLNPAEKLAYLIPRDKRVCLDISYFGLMKLATDSEKIEWIKPVLVYANDIFKVNGVNSLPEHCYNPFDNYRGAIVGGYSVAKLVGEEDNYIVDFQPESYFIKCKNKALTKAVWDAWPEAQRLKCLIRAGYKFWPKAQRLNAAVHLLNEQDSDGIVSDPVLIGKPTVTKPESKKELEKLKSAAQTDIIPEGKEPVSVTREPGVYDEEDDEFLKGLNSGKSKV